METRKPNGKALLPIVVFLILYLGSGIYFEYIRPIEGQMGFYIMSVVVAFSIALIVAMMQNRSLSFNEKIHICSQGIGDDNITIMLFIFLMAGAFSGIAKEAGGAVSIANLLLSIIPSDTTIAATNTQGVEMKDKFRTNFRIALPAAVLTLIILIIYALRGNAVPMGSYDYNIIQALPYFIVLVMAIVGINVFIVLGTGIVLFLLAGVATGSLTFVSAFTSMGNGTSGMFETMIVTILVASIGSLIRENGGFAAILAFIKKHFSGKKGGMAGISLLTILMDIATANNTVAIVMAAPIARTITEEYGIDPKKTASLLDTCSCIAQGIIPYGAQLLIAASLAGISSMAIIPFLFYPYLLAVFVVVSIVIEK